MSKQETTQLVLLQDICSQEYYAFRNGERRQVLSNICMEGKAGESWAFLGDSAFELRLLLEIIANARPYQKGRCVLAQIGMMRKKKVILPHVFYIGSTNMLFEHMQVLDYLHMLHVHQKKNAFILQKKLLQDLLDIGLGPISLSPIAALSAQEKALFTLFTSLYQDSNIIIMNLARLPLSVNEIQILCRISEKLRQQRKIFLFSTKYPEVAQACATHLLCLYKGESLYQGALSSFMDEYDKQILHLEDPHMQMIHDILVSQADTCEYERNGNQLDVFVQDSKQTSVERIFHLLDQYAQIPRKFVITDPSLSNAWKERKKRYDE